MVLLDVHYPRSNRRSGGLDLSLDDLSTNLDLETTLTSGLIDYTCFWIYRFIGLIFSLFRVLKFFLFWFEGPSTEGVSTPQSIKAI